MCTWSSHRCSHLSTKLFAGNPVLRQLSRPTPIKTKINITKHFLLLLLLRHKNLCNILIIFFFFFFFAPSQHLSMNFLSALPLIIVPAFCILGLYRSTVDYRMNYNQCIFCGCLNFRDHKFTIGDQLYEWQLY